MWKWLVLTACPWPLLGASVRVVRVEEPTGLYRRTDEVTAVPLKSLGNNREGFRVTGPAGDELPWQVSGDELLFPASLIPGELPQYRISCCDAGSPPGFRNEIVARKVGMRRLEAGNSRFLVVIDTGVPAITHAYNLSADEHRRLNLVETSPEGAEAARGDMHFNQQARALLTDPSAIQGENTGWTSLGGSGPVESVEFLETGPLRGRVRLGRQGETWELVWTAGSAALRWKAREGFRFAAVSALPYLPFDRFVDGSEYRKWPDGPIRDEPPDHAIGVRSWRKIPGGHGVYYRHDENYGALGIVALDGELEWQGLGSRRFEARRAGGDSEIAITFPRWKGIETLLEARKENRILRNPLLVRVSGSSEESGATGRGAPHDPEYRVEENAPEPSPYRPLVLSLDGEWELAWGEKGQGPSSGWKSVRVPGSVHTQVLEASKYHSREAEWISYKEWWYRKRFRIPREFTGHRLRLHFEATDYYADAFLNGHELGRHEGYIDPYSYDVTPAARPDEGNELLVRVWTPVTYYWRHRPYYVKGSYGAVDQKPDDITALGITRSVRLVAGDDAQIGEISVNTPLHDDGSAAVEVTASVDGPEQGLRWELTLRPANFQAASRGAGRADHTAEELAGNAARELSREVDASKGSDSYRILAPAQAGPSRFVFPLKNPKLWWTWDHGHPNLYLLSVRLLAGDGTAVDGRDLRVGVREIEHIGWTFYLNRKRLFIRGTNYYYNLFLSEMDRAAYERDLRLMLGMNVNMIRLHCHFTNPEFYDLADENGVLIFQDFLEAWYPHDRAFSLRAASLYDPLIRYVRNHPSVALWATSDEEDFENYRDLTKHLAPRPFFLDPQRRAVVRSTGRYGDAHTYEGWYGGTIWDYARTSERFISELGATALPNYESLVKFLPGKWPIADHAEDWIFHKLQIPEAMRAWGEPGGRTLAEYIPVTQNYAARLFQIALERMRRIRYQPAGGILHFHAIDIWPSVTMAAIDYYRVPTKVYYTVQRSFAPVLASLEYDRDRWRAGETVSVGVWAINDRWEALPGAELRWRISGPTGQEVLTGAYSLDIEPDSARKLGEVRWKATDPGSYRLLAEIRDSSRRQVSENIFEFEVGAK